MKGYLSIREIFGRSWAIPENAKKPEDPRRGDYMLKK